MSRKRYIVKIIVMLVLMLTFCCTVNTYADGTVDNNDYSNEVVPGYEKTSRWSYTNSVHAALTLSSSGSATATTSVDGYQNITTKIIIYTYLQKLAGNEWTNVDSASHTAYSWHAAYQDPMTTVPWGHDYRTRNSVYVYSGDSYENIVFYSNIHHYHSTGDNSNCVN